LSGRAKLRLDRNPRLSPAFEKRQESAEGVAHVQQHLAAQEFGDVVRVGHCGHRFAPDCAALLS